MRTFNDRKFRWLLRLLPREFREDHESELLQVWRDEVGDAGVRRTRAVWYAALVDTVRVAPKEHVMAFSSHLRIAIRQLRRAPAFAAAAMLTLGVGLGATAGVFSVVNAVLLRPMPWHAPEEVALIWAVTPTGSQTWLSYPEIEDLQKDATQWAGIAAFTDVRPQLTRAGVAEELQGVAVSHGLFRLLGVTPAFGRDFAREDDRPEAAGVVIVSDALWRTRLGADPAAIGRSMRLDGREHVVVGVLPSGFDLLPASSVLPGRIDVWLPLEPRLASRDRTVRFLHALGRVAGHATFATARDEIAAYGPRLSAAHPAAYTDGIWTFRAVPFADDVLRPSRTPLLLLLALVSVALLMACANVTNLLLARGEARRGELAIRTALGASPARLAGELLTEGCVLAVGGGVLGLGLATAVPRAIRAVAPDAFPRLSQASMDARVAGVMVVLGLVTIAVFSAIPMLERSRVRAPSMSLTGRGGQRTRRSARAGQLLTVVQTAMATTVVVMSLTLGDALTRLQRVSLGFVTTDVTTARLTRPPVSETNIAAPEFYEQVLRTVEALPGVSGASVITQLPLSGTMLGSTFIRAQHPIPMRVDVDLRGISASYFDVLGVRRVRGRAFSASDTADSPPVAIVDEAFARRLQPDGAVLGSRIRWIRQPNVDIEIVGVVDSVHHRGPAGTVRETVYRPLTQYPRAAMFLAVKTESQALLSSAALEAAVRSVDPGQPVADVQTMDARLAAFLGGVRLSTTVAETLAAMAVGLAGVGLYGLLSFGTALRFREFGIRLALGDTPAGVRRSVMSHGLALTLAGVLIGTAGAAVGAALARSLLSGTVVEIRPSLVGGAIVLGCSALAFGIPAWRASSVDPTITLRAE